MKKVTSKDPAAKSHDQVAENVIKLKTLFPELFTESKDGVSVNLDILKQLLGDRTVSDSDEKFGLSWHGKRRARQLALAPSTGTLRPCPPDSIDWDTTKNLIIEGDNLEVLKILQKSYAGRVKLIYIDPPYNTGKDFVYPDNFQDNIKNYLELTGQTGEGGKKLSSNTETSGRFHTDWLNMIYPRLKLARNLLRDDGVIFVTIDDNEVHNLRAVMNEIFGEENFVAQVEWQKRYTRSNNTDDFTSVIDHVCIYQKSDGFKVNLLARGEEADARFTNPDNDPRGPWKATPFLNQVAPERRPNLCYPITNPHTGKVANPDKKAWRYERSVFQKLLDDNRLYWGKDNSRDVPDIKTFLSEVREGMTPINFWSHQYASHTDQANREIKELFGDKVFDTPKPVLLIQRMLEHGTTGDDVVIDFFAGTGTTGHAVLAQNAQDGKQRRYLLVQLPEPLDSSDPGQKVAADFCDQLKAPRLLSELTKERLRRAGKKIKAENPLFVGDLGFRVFKLDSTNIREWDPNSEALAANLEAAIDHLKADRTEQDILFELLLKLGLDLCVPIKTKKVLGHEIHSIGSGSLIACLSIAISQADIEPLALHLVAWIKEQQPAGDTTVVFRDSAFVDDVAKTNLTSILQQHGVETVRSI